jgi:hypothetical protein
MPEVFPVLRIPIAAVVCFDKSQDIFLWDPEQRTWSNLLWRLAIVARLDQADNIIPAM